MSDDPRLPGPRDPKLPSDLELDRLRAGELSAGEERALREKIAASPAAQARWEEIERGLPDALPSERLLARIMDAVEGGELSPELQAALDASLGRDGTPPPRRSRWARFVDWASDGWQPRAMVAGLAAAAAVIAIAVTGQRPADPLGSGTRLKGGVALTVYRLPAGESEATLALSGDEFSAGDRLRFAVSLPHAGHLLIAYSDARGDTIAAWPLSAVASRPVEADPDLRLDGAVELDASSGHEWLHAVLCPAPFRLDALTPGATPGALTLPAGCTQSGFMLDKAGPR